MIGNTTTTASMTVNVDTNWKGWRRVPQKPSRVAGLFLSVLDVMCSAMDHAGACGIMNRRFYLLCNDETCRLVIPNPFRRAVEWANVASDDHRWERWDRWNRRYMMLLTRTGMEPSSSVQAHTITDPEVGGETEHQHRGSSGRKYPGQGHHTGFGEVE